MEHKLFLLHYKRLEHHLKGLAVPRKILFSKIIFCTFFLTEMILLSFFEKSSKTCYFLKKNKEF